MHELGIMQQIVKGVFNAALSVEAKEVKTVTLLIGELRNFQQTWVQFYFDLLTKDSIAAGAKVVVESVPATALCQDCGETFKVDVHAGEANICCPACRSKAYEFCTGNEMILKNIELGGSEDGKEN